MNRIGVKKTYGWLLWIALAGLMLAGCAECGDDVCSIILGESSANCPEDCSGNWLPDAAHHHFVCGNGIVDPGETCESEADCMGGTDHCNRDICQCVSCAEMALDFTGACGTDEECVEQYGEAYFCNQAACNCFTCPAGSDACRSEADCPGTDDHCNQALCECVSCAEMPLDFTGACATDEQCVEQFGAGYFCNQAACNCMTCPAASDGCRSESDCPGADDHCNRALCECVPCSEMALDFPGACGTDADCVAEYGEGYFCNQAACNCLSCPAGSDGCHNDTDCQRTLSNPAAYCVEALCECFFGCGDGYCDTATENTDLCPNDCPCEDDGTCSLGEGSICADCGAIQSACGAACQSSDDCREGLSCFNNVCWDDCVCEQRCGEATAEPEPECIPCQDPKDCVNYCGPSAGASCSNAGCCVCIQRP